MLYFSERSKSPVCHMKKSTLRKFSRDFKDMVFLALIIKNNRTSFEYTIQFKTVVVNFILVKTWL